MITRMRLKRQLRRLVVHMTLKALEAAKEEIRRFNAT